MAMWRGRTRVGDALARHPRFPLAVKCAVAAALAWVLVLPLDGIADDYPYYAPLGAVVAMGTTVVNSVRASVQGVLALLSGAAVSVGAATLPLPDVVAIAVVVGISTLVAG